METEKDEIEEEKLVADSDFKQEEYDLHFHISEMHSPILDLDEYEYFTQHFRRVQSTSPDSLNALLALTFTTVKLRNYLKSVLATKRVVLKAKPSKNEESKGKKKSKAKGSKSKANRKGPGIGEDMDMGDSGNEEVEEESTNQTQTEEICIPRKFIKVSRRDPALLQQMASQ